MAPASCGVACAISNGSSMSRCNLATAGCSVASIPTASSMSMSVACNITNGSGTNGMNSTSLGNNAIAPNGPSANANAAINAMISNCTAIGNEIVS